MPPQRCPCPNPTEFVNMSPYMAKGSLQIWVGVWTLRYWDYFGLSGFAQFLKDMSPKKHRAFLCGVRGMKQKKKERFKVGKESPGCLVVRSWALTDVTQVQSLVASLHTAGIGQKKKAQSCKRGQMSKMEKEGTSFMVQWLRLPWWSCG